METSGPATQVMQSLLPLLQIAVVLWAAETILTMLIKEHRKTKKKKEREKRRLEYQDRRMANDEEHAKVTRAMATISSSTGLGPVVPRSRQIIFGACFSK